MPYPFLFQNTTTQTLIVPGAYCRTEDVQALFKNIAGFSTLDVDEINRRIADAAVEIDGLLRPAYVTPVAGDPDALGILRLVNSRLAAAVIGEVYFRSAQPNDAPQIHQWRTFAELLLKDILDGAVHFFAATPQSGGELPQFPAGAGATFNPDNDMDASFGQQPIFQRTSRGNKSSLGDLI